MAKNNQAAKLSPPNMFNTRPGAPPVTWSQADYLDMVYPNRVTKESKKKKLAKKSPQ